MDAPCCPRYVSAEENLKKKSPTRGKWRWQTLGQEYIKAGTCARSSGLLNGQAHAGILRLSQPKYPQERCWRW
jgi:hypothetical protein